jgi:alkanesulfonate monooxygenase SsuD/methylene tetrahydromethanopterin reductase-like flavin-dependent oxidoreductase (luciferase family)
MDLGVCMAATIDDIEHAVLAEQLGFSHVWVADSQMLWSDCYATLALIAARTSRIKIGTGVAVAGTRSVAVTAAAHATLNRIAPGRVFCGMGTGNTAMRVMGHRPMPIGEFEDHLVSLRLLLDGDEATVSWRGRPSLVRHLMPDHGFVGFTPRIPLYVSGFGPRAMALAARLGDGLVMSVPPVPEAVQRVWARLDAAAAGVGRAVDPSSFLTTTLTTMFVTEPGEPTDSARVREGVGAFAIAAMHYLYEQWREAGRPDQPGRYPGWDDYVAMLDTVDPERLHQRIHGGHNCWVLPEEERFVTKELIDATCMVGTAADLAARLRALEQAGLSQVMLLPPLAVRDQVLRDVAEQVMPLLAAQ